MTIASGQIISAGDISNALAGKLPLAGGTLTGPLVLAADPVAALQAVTKQYGDALDTLTTAAIAAVSATATAAVPIAGGTMTGGLLLAGNPVLAMHAATKQYVDALIAGLLPNTLVALSALIAAAPTTLPIAPGVLWVNNGVVSIS